MQLPTGWQPGPGWINTNPLYWAFFIIFLSLPITLPLIFKLYQYFKKKEKSRDDEKNLTEKQKKKLERERRKEIRRKKRKVRS